MNKLFVNLIYICLIIICFDIQPASARNKKKEVMQFETTSSQGRLDANVEVRFMIEQETIHYGLNLTLKPGRYRQFPQESDEKIRACLQFRTQVRDLSTVMLEGDFKENKITKVYTNTGRRIQTRTQFERFCRTRSYDKLIDITDSTENITLLANNAIQ